MEPNKTDFGSEVRELTEEEANAITKDITEVLIRHNAEIGVKSSIQIMKRKDIVSPFVPQDVPKEGGDQIGEAPKTD